MFDFILPPDDLKPIIILDDRGGRVSNYIKAAQNYTDQGREIRIIGLFWLACSLALSVPNVCVGPMATVMFHDAYNLRSGKTDSASTKDLFDRLPVKIQKAAGGKIQKDFHAEGTLDAEKLMILGIKKCFRELD
jgi:hypothetical protein